MEAFGHMNLKKLFCIFLFQFMICFYNIKSYADSSLENTAADLKDEVTNFSASNCVTNITIRKNNTSLLIFWDGIATTAPSFIIEVFKTTNQITNAGDLNTINPYRQVTNEYYLEDTDILFGVPYYYLLIVNGNKIILDGKNCNLKPVLFGSTNEQVNVETEVFSKTNETLHDSWKSLKIKRFPYVKG